MRKLLKVLVLFGSFAAYCQSNPVEVTAKDAYAQPLLIVPPVFPKNTSQELLPLELRMTGTVDAGGNFTLPVFTPAQNTTDFTRAVLDVLPYWRFRPALDRKACKAVDSKAVVNIYFELKEGQPSISVSSPARTNGAPGRPGSQAFVTRPTIQYPASMLARGIEGSVEALMRVNGKGEVVERSLLFSIPKPEFGVATIEGLRRVEFSSDESIKDLEATSCYTVPIKFCIENGHPDYADPKCSPEYTKNEESLAAIKRGDALLGKGDYDKAMAEYQEAIRIDVKSGAGYTGRGNVWFAKNEFDRAISEYDEAIRLSPQYKYAYLNRGRAWNRKGEFERSIADYGEVLRIDPKFAMAYNNRGFTWFGRRDFEHAIADYDEAIRLEPRLTIAYTNRANAWTEKGEKERALADYNEVIRIRPGDAAGWINRGAAWARNGDQDKAIADFNEAIRLDPKSDRAYVARGLAWGHIGDYDREISNFNEATRIKPQSAVAHNSLGHAHFDHERFADSAADFERSLRIDARQPYAVIWRYLALARSGAGNPLSELSSASAVIDKQKWPAPVIELFVGRMQPEALLAAAENPDPKTRRDQLCEGRLYLGEWHLLNSRAREARPLLEQAQRSCPATFVEAKAAAMELKRLAATAN
jgi:tetratricopeptide (TPR) repeat protein